MNVVRRVAAIILCLFVLPTLKASAQGTYGNDVGVSFTPVIQTAAYATGNSLGGLQTVQFFRSSALSATLNYFDIGSKGGSTVAMTVYIFDTSPGGSTCTDKSAFSLANADLAKLAIAPFVLTPAIIGAGTTATLAQLVQVVPVRNQDTPARTANLYICIVANAAVTPASTADLVGKISGRID